MADVQEPRNALWRREEQIRRWNLSDTHSISPDIKNNKKISVQFQEGCVFLAACSSCDKNEIQTLLERGADINTANIDGLTALHQACIDDNLNMVTFLIEKGADIDACDNEGWTALHATASCGFLEIAKYLIEKGADIAAVNNDGELAYDLAEGDDMEDLLAEEMEEHGIDAEAARNEEENVMLQHANQWLNGKYNEEPHEKTGATALHVAAAKGYMKVISILLQAGVDINAKDFDGWTPLHASAHWGQDEACKLLVENLCDMDATNSSGQTALDLADSDVIPLLEELKKSQASMKEKNLESNVLNDISSEHRSQMTKRRSSVTRMSGDQKQHLVSKSVEDERSKLEELLKVDEEKEEEKKSETESVEDESSSSQDNEEEEASSESDTDKQSMVDKKVAEKKPETAVKKETKNEDDIVRAAGSTLQMETEETKPPPPKSTSEKPAIGDSDFEKPAEVTLPKKDTENIHDSKEMESKSRSVLAENNKKNQDKTESITSILGKRDYTSRLSDELKDEKVKKNEISTGLTPKPSSSSTSNLASSTESSSSDKLNPASWRAGLRKTGSSSAVPDPSDPRSDSDKLSRSASSSWIEKPEKKEEDSASSRRQYNSWLGEEKNKFNNLYARYTSLLHTNKPSTNSTSVTTTKPSSSSSLIGSNRSSYTPYSRQRHLDGGDRTSSDINTPTSPIGSTATTTITTTGSRRHGSFEPPKRDEEKEVERKARAKRARETRRSTQGVTKEDIQKAEESLKLANQDIDSGKKNKLGQNERDIYNSSDDKSDKENKPEDTLSLSSNKRRPWTTATDLDKKEDDSSRRTGLGNETLSTKKEDPSQKSTAIRTRRKRESRRPTGKITLEDIQGTTKDETESPEEKKEESVTMTSKCTSSRKSEPVGSIHDSTSRTTSSLSKERPSSFSGSTDSRSSYTRASIDSDKSIQKLYEQEKKENERLRKEIDKLKEDLTESQLDLERTKLKTESKSNDLREKRALERKISELEEEVKTMENLKSDNQRLKEENGALIRVISKLSK